MMRVQVLRLVLALLGQSISWPTAATSSLERRSDNTDHAAFPFNPGFPIQKVLDLAQAISSHSWEFGTATEALLEIYNPEISVFGASPFEAVGGRKSSIPRGLAYAAKVITIGTGANALADGDGAVGDPASLGVGAVLLGKIKGFDEYANAAEETVKYVTQGAPRAPNGAISHRVDIVELWADFVYMAPPFLAYYAADTSNITLLRESVDQCRFYRERLQVKTASPQKGLWQHIQGPQHDDPGLWSTGNAWAAAGMTRVLATVIKSPFLQPRKGKREDLRWRTEAINGLTTWIGEILDGAIEAGKDAYKDGLVKNYFDKPETFGEISGSALLAATAYRMAVLGPARSRSKYVMWADSIRKTLGGRFFDEISGGVLDHVDGKNGTVRPAVNPLGWGDTNPWMTGSPEGQSFVVLLYAAWRDCIFAGRCSRN